MEPFVFVTGLYFDSELQEDIRCKFFIKILPLLIAFFSRIYFPIQNLEKIFPNTSSFVNSPEISPNCSNAFLNSYANNSV